MSLAEQETEGTVPVNRVQIKGPVPKPRGLHSVYLHAMLTEKNPSYLMRTPEGLRWRRRIPSPEEPGLRRYAEERVRRVGGYAGGRSGLGLDLSISIW